MARFEHKVLTYLSIESENMVEAAISSINVASEDAPGGRDRVVAAGYVGKRDGNSPAPPNPDLGTIALVGDPLDRSTSSPCGHFPDIDPNGRSSEYREPADKAAAAEPRCPAVARGTRGDQARGRPASTAAAGADRLVHEQRVP